VACRQEGRTVPEPVSSGMGLMWLTRFNSSVNGSKSKS
jgi:hypothetical protein